ncbi:MAG: histidine phosphatase family protein, partial [Mesorhizobium sp.]
MSKLYLLRHAKAGWALPGMRDFDRPLDASGLADAATMGAAMRARSYIPDLTLCSNAKRARQTLEGLAGHTDTGRVLFLDTLYSEDAAGYLSIIRGNGGPGSLLVIGHNPMTEDLTIALSG